MEKATIIKKQLPGVEIQPNIIIPTLHTHEPIEWDLISGEEIHNCYMNITKDTAPRVSKINYTIINGIHGANLHT